MTTHDIYILAGDEPTLFVYPSQQHAGVSGSVSGSTSSSGSVTGVPGVVEEPPTGVVFVPLVEHRSGFVRGVTVSNETVVHGIRGRSPRVRREEELLLLELV